MSFASEEVRKETHLTDLAKGAIAPIVCTPEEPIPITALRKGGQRGSEEAERGGRTYTRSFLNTFCQSRSAGHWAV